MLCVYLGAIQVKHLIFYIYGAIAFTIMLQACCQVILRVRRLPKDYDMPLCQAKLSECIHYTLYQVPLLHC